MKKTKIKKNPSMAFLSLLGMVILGSCQSAPEATTRKNRLTQGAYEPVVYETVVKAESIPLNPMLGDDSPRMLIIVTLQNVPETGRLGMLIRDLLYDGLDAEKYGERVIGNYRAQYLDSAKDTRLDSDKPMETWNWEYNETIEGSTLSLERDSTGKTGYFIVSRSREYYLGGAHGMREKKYFIIDTESVKALSLEDLIQEDAGIELRRMVESELRRRFEIPSGTPLSEGGLFTDLSELTENCFLTTEGLGFHWDPYEIAPYSFGPVEVIIPFDELEDILRGF
jgi:hypothetical protein